MPGLTRAPLEPFQIPGCGWTGLVRQRRALGTPACGLDKPRKDSGISYFPEKNEAGWVKGTLLRMPKPASGCAVFFNEDAASAVF